MAENIESLKRSRKYAWEILRRTKKQLRASKIHGGFETNILDYIHQNALPSTAEIKARAENILSGIMGLDEGIAKSAYGEVFGNANADGKTHRALLEMNKALGSRAYTGDALAIKTTSELEARMRVQTGLRRREILGLLREKQRLEADYHAFLGGRLKEMRKEGKK